MHFSGPPYCVAPSPRTLWVYLVSSLASLRFLIVFCCKSHLNCSLFPNFTPSFPKFDVGVRTTFQYSGGDMSFHVGCLFISFWGCHDSTEQFGVMVMI
jgi:hypothetical protein